jgi:hypothetical protein
MYNCKKYMRQNSLAITCDDMHNNSNRMSMQDKILYRPYVHLHKSIISTPNNWDDNCKLITELLQTVGLNMLIKEDL